MFGPRVLVIGAGFGGLGVARALRQQGIEQVRVLERGPAVGGVWRDNTYPGAACDVPSPLYSWSWAVNPHWSHRYSGQAEILRYLERTARDEGLLELVRFGQCVTEATYGEETATWTVRTADGTAYEADVVVSAVGQLSEPLVPDLPGVGSFTGPAFHSARWRDDVPLAGRRVAVVGTGASAVQLVPGIVDEVGAMTVFQRTPTWVLPRLDPERRARTLPRLRSERRWIFRLTELYNRALGGRSAVARPLMALIRAVSRIHLRRQVPDADLRRALTPVDPVGCKRLLFSSTWFPALAREHVEVVSQPVTAVEPTGVRTRDGRLHEADVLIWGTGFAATDFLRSIRVVGRGGAELAAVWAERPAAYLGVAVPGFPNLFCVYGPHTNLGGSSIIGMLEAQAGWIAQVTRRLADTRARAAEVRPEALARFDAELDDRLGDSAWARCESWYQRGGRVSTNWPGLVAEYQDRLARVRWTDLEVAAEPGADRPDAPLGSSHG